MMKSDGCCGQPQRRRRMGPAQEPLPANPTLTGGVAMIYLGSGRREIAGSSTGHRYFVADQRRHFRAAPSDVDDLLRRREFMLKV
jgi:hypothetical protein